MLLGWYESNCDFTLLNFPAWYWDIFLHVVMLYIILMCMSCFFFANNLLLAVYFILWKSKSKFKWFSYLSSKWIVKQQRQLATSTMHLAQELLMNVQCSGSSRSFEKETRALKIRSTLPGHLVDSDQLRGLSELIL